MTENTNNIPAPYFSVGEEVILESVFLPEHNGEYIVQDRLYKDWICAMTGKIIKVYSYDLGFTAKSGTEWWQESALRKKYPPSKLSFSEMLESFNKQPVTDNL